MSSLRFLGNATSYLRIPNTDAFDFGQGDFTIEWYQYQTDSNSFPRIFQVGNYLSGLSIGVSIEGGNFYYWTNNTFNLATTILPSNYKNKWVHFAISRSSGVTKIFMNGVSVFTMNDANDFNGTNDLVISNESTPSNGAAFGGYITYFSWIKGTALYTTDFSVPTNYPTLTNDYVLLLTASDFSGTLGSSVANTNVSTIPNLPPGFLSNNNNTSSDTTIYRPNLKNIFSDNSLVFYKPGSLPSCGVGTVRNSSMKSRKI
jgi:hypothetical protein